MSKGAGYEGAFVCGGICGFLVTIVISIFGFVALLPRVMPIIERPDHPVFPSVKDDSVDWESAVRRFNKFDEDAKELSLGVQILQTRIFNHNLELQGGK